MRASLALRLGVAALGLLGIGGTGLYFVAASRSSESEQGFLASVISRALSTPASRVQIGGVDGALSSDATIRDIVIADRDGVWLRLDRAHIRWRRAALLLRRLEIDQLEIGHLDISRRPVRSDDVVKDADKPLLPDLPVKVEIKHFGMANLDLGETVLGVAMRAAATGDTSLGSPADGLSFHLDGQRLDSPGHFLAALSYVPKDKALGVKVKLDEPAGGLVSRLANLPGAPPVTLDLDGNGTLDAFAGTIDFVAGPKIDAKGQVTLDRKGAGRVLATRVGGHLGAMLPGPAAPVFEGETSLASDLRFADDGTIALDGVRLDSHLARLEARGTLSADRVMDFAASIRALPNQGDVSALGGASIRSLVFDSNVKGPVTAPRVAAKLALADAHLPAGALGRLDARFSAAPGGEITDTGTRIALDGQVDASGIVPADPALGRAIGGAASLTMHGSTDLRGDATFDKIEAKTPTIVASYAGALGAARVRGRAGVSAPDLSRFGDLAGLKLAGRAAIDAEVTGDPAQATWDVALSGGASDLVTGIAAADGALGRTVSFTGRLGQSAGAYKITDLALGGAHVASRVSGTLGAKSGDVAAAIDLLDLARVDPHLTGKGGITARLTGGIDAPALALAARLDDATAMGRPIPHLALDVAGHDLRRTPSLRATLEGSVDRKTARGLIEAGATPDGWALRTLDVAVGSVTLAGGGTLDKAHHVDGKIALAADNLDDLSALALTKLGGRLKLDAAFAAPDGRQSVAVKADAADLKAAGAAIRRLGLRLDAQDALAHPVIDADAAIDQVLVGGQTISAIKFTAKGEAAQSAMKLSARAAGFDLDAAGALVPGASPRFDLASFSARRGARRIALAGPAHFALSDGGVDIRDFALGVAGGRVTADGHAGKTLGLKIEAKAVPLSAAEIAVPGLGLGGTLDASARVAGTSVAPSGDYTLSLRKLVAPQTREAGIPPIDVAAHGRLAGGRVTLDSTVAAGRAGSLTATGAAPLDKAGAIDLAVRGRLDAAVANATFGPGGRTVGGAVQVDAKVGGTRTMPRISGGATMAGGTFRDTLLGVRLDGIGFKVAAQGDRVVIERLAASTPNGGTLSGSGDVRVDPAAGFPGHLTLRGSKASLADSSLMSATADVAIDISGALARSPRIGGRVDLTHVDVGIPDRLPSTLKPIDGITHVNAPQHAAARLALLKKRAKAAAGTKGRAALFDAMLDVTIAAPNRIFVRGRGVDAELGGTLRVTGSTEHPTPKGAFALRTGKLVALGKTLNFTKGNLTFTGDLVPEVDFAAEIAADSLTAQIAVTGPAAAPAFAFTSSPTLPQDEILSRVLFNKPSGNLSGFQALQLAQAAAQFSSGGDGAFEKLRKSLGVDSLDVGSGSTGGPSVGVSRAISDRVKVGVTTGATADETGLSADVDVTKHVRVQSSVRSNGSTSVGVGSEIEY